MLKTRSRIINFRVTEDEFARLRTASVEHGSRCLSDYARSALMHALEDCCDLTGSRAIGLVEMQALVQRLGIVELTVARLASMVSTLAPNERKPMSLGASV